MSIEDEDAYDDDRPFEPNMIFVMPARAYNVIDRRRMQELSSLVVRQTDPYEFQVLKTRHCEDPIEPVGFGTIAEMIERTTLA